MKSKDKASHCPMNHIKDKLSSNHHQNHRAIHLVTLFFAPCDHQRLRYIAFEQCKHQFFFKKKSYM